MSFKGTDIKMRQIILAIVTAYMSYYALMQNFNNSGGGGIEKTIAALAVFGIEIYLISHIRELNKKERRVFTILGALFSLFWVIGKWAFFYENYSASGHKAIKLLIMFIGGFFLYGSISAFIYMMLKIVLAKDSGKLNEPGMSKIVFVSAIAFAGIVFLAVHFPGTSFTDGLRQMDCYFREVEWVNHDPAFSTFLIGTCISIGKHFGSDNLGMFLYNLLIFIFSTWIFWMVIRLFNKMKTPRWLCYLAAVYYVILPIVRYYLVTVCKDTLYALTVMLIVLQLIDMRAGVLSVIGDRKSSAQKKSDEKADVATTSDDNEKRKQVKKLRIAAWIKLFVVLLLSCNLRNDGIYVAAFTLFISFFCFKGLKKKAAVLVMAVLLGVFHVVYGSVILPACDIKAGSEREALSVPLQQTAFLLKEHPETYTKQEMETLDDFFDGHLKDIPEVYNPNLSDPVKDRVVYYPTDQQKKDYMNLWLKGLKAHPKTYIKTYLFNYYGYIYPNMRGDEDGFSDYAFSKRYPNVFEFKQLTIMEKPIKLIVKYMSWFSTAPVLSLLYNPGFYTWMLIFAAAIILGIDKRKIYCLSPLFGILIIACLSPVNCRLRYILGIIYCMPIVWALLVEEMRSAGSKQ